jgi:hypothetical protein
MYRRLVTVAAMALVTACGGADEASPTTLSATTTTAESTTTTVTTTTTVAETTTTTLPEVQSAVLDGEWTAQLSYPGTDQTLNPPRERKYVFTADCTADPCEISGLIETALANVTVDVSHDGRSYSWSVDDEDVDAEDNGRVVCTWARVLNYSITVTKAEFVGDVWTATEAAGHLIEVSTTIFEAPDVTCEGGELDGVLEMARN